MRNSQRRVRYPQKQTWVDGKTSLVLAQDGSASCSCHFSAEALRFSLVPGRDTLVWRFQQKDKLAETRKPQKGHWTPTTSPGITTCGTASATASAALVWHLCGAHAQAERKITAKPDTGPRAYGNLVCDTCGIWSHWGKTAFYTSCVVIGVWT